MGNTLGYKLEMGNAVTLRLTTPEPLNAVCCKGKHHKSVPQFSEIPARVGNMIVRLIAINSGYTSRVLVRQSSL